MGPENKLLDKITPPEMPGIDFPFSGYFSKTDVTIFLKQLRIKIA